MSNNNELLDTEVRWVGQTECDQDAAKEPPNYIFKEYQIKQSETVLSNRRSEATE